MKCPACNDTGVIKRPHGQGVEPCRCRANNHGFNDDDADPLEMLRCAQANFDNLIEQNPVIASHPMYQVARLQLDDAVAIVTRRTT